MNKQITLESAADLVKTGDTLAIGGVTLYRRPLAFVHALLKRFLRTGEPHHLTLLAFTAGIESDLLVGAGMIKQVRSCYFGLEIFGLAPMFTYLANRGEIEIVEETEASLSYGLRARMAGVGFMPGRAWLGTDLPRLRPDVQTVTDPYTGESLMAFPAICPDVTLIHALEADLDGNAQIGGNQGIDLELAQAAPTVLVTCEKLQPGLERADLAAPYVSAVIHAPHGALPTSCYPFYPLDGEALLAYTEKVSDPDSFRRYLKNVLM